MTSYYDVLGVSVSAETEEVRRAYHRKARLLHPDRFAGAPEPEQQRAEAEMKALNEAWNTLGNPEARRRYDIELGLPVRDDEEPEPDPEAFWGPHDGEEPVPPSLLRRRGVRMAVVVVLVAGIVVSAVAFLAPAENHRGRWSPAAITDLRSAAINAGMSTAQADCFVESVTSRYSPSDEVEQAAIQQLADGCR